MRLWEPIVLMATGKGDTTPFTVGFSIKQRLAAARLFHLAVGEFGDFQFRRDRLLNANQLACPVELVNPIA